MTKDSIATLLLILSPMLIAEVVDSEYSLATIADSEYSSVGVSLDYLYGDKEEHEEREEYGFKFYIHLDVLETQKEAAEKAFDQLKGQLYDMKLRFPVNVLKRLKQEGVKIVINDDCGTEEAQEAEECEVGPFACYVAERWWQPEFYSKAVVIRDLETLIKSKLQQPGLLIHEMAHAFHDLFVGFSNKDIIDAYEKALSSGKYESVSRNHYHGWDTNREKVRAYSLTNHKEFFAEMSEAIWLVNDFEPFTSHDVLEDEILSTHHQDGKRSNIVHDIWWRCSGPHSETPWFYQNLEEDESE